MMSRIWNDESGILTFEWILLLVVLVIGIVGGVAAIKDALIIESAETAGAVVALNQSYNITASIGGTVTSTGSLSFSRSDVSGMGGTSYTDAQGRVTAQ